MLKTLEIVENSYLPPEPIDLSLLSAKQFWNSIFDTTVSMHRLGRELTALLWCMETASRTTQTDGHGGGGHSDPTASAAVALDGESERAEMLHLELCRSQDMVGYGLAMVGGIRKAMGDGYADAMEMRFLDGAEAAEMRGRRLAWREIAEELGVSEATVLRRYEVVCDWMDDVGHDAAMMGLLGRGRDGRQED